MGVQGRMGLPLHIDTVRVWRSTGEPTGPVYAIVTPSADQQSFSAEVIDGSGSLCIAVSGYRTVAIPTDKNTFKAINAAVSGSLVTA